MLVLSSVMTWSFLDVGFILLKHSWSICTNCDWPPHALLEDSRLKTLFRCLLSLPLLPVDEVWSAFEDMKSTLDDQSPAKSLMQQLLQYVEKQWLDKSTIGPSRLSVHDNQARTANAVKSFHAALLQRVKVPHPNLFAFLGHLQKATIDSQLDVGRITSGLPIRSTKKRVNLVTTKTSRCACRDSTMLNTRDSNFYMRLAMPSAQIRWSVTAGRTWTTMTTHTRMMAHRRRLNIHSNVQVSKICKAHSVREKPAECQIWVLPLLFQLWYFTLVAYSFKYFMSWTVCRFIEKNNIILPKKCYCLWRLRGEWVSEQFLNATSAQCRLFSAIPLKMEKRYNIQSKWTKENKWATIQEESLYCDNDGKDIKPSVSIGLHAYLTSK